VVPPSALVVTWRILWSAADGAMISPAGDCDGCGVAAGAPARLSQADPDAVVPAGGGEPPCAEAAAMR
jgi:hypothetical protein